MSTTTFIDVNKNVYHLLGWQVDEDGFHYLLVDSPTYDEIKRTPYRHYPKSFGQPPILVRRGGQPDVDFSDHCQFLEGQPCFIVEAP